MREIKEVEIVSDGVVMTFTNDEIIYFPANALYEQQRGLGAQNFLSYDPSNVYNNTEGETLLTTRIHNRITRRNRLTSQLLLSCR